jgi:hypothetical protein
LWSTGNLPRRDGDDHRPIEAAQVGVSDDSRVSNL